MIEPIEPGERQFTAATLEQLTALIVELQSQIDDDYRSEGQDDDTPTMDITIGTTDGTDYGWQTGDNSFTGGAYSHRFWFVYALTRECIPADVATDCINQFNNDMNW